MQINAKVIKSNDLTNGGAREGRKTAAKTAAAP